MPAPSLAQEVRGQIAALPRRDTPTMRALRRAWTARLKPSPASEVIALAQALETAAPQEGKWFAYELIRHHAGAFAAIGPTEVEDFATRARSWYAVDAFGTILAGPLWARGELADAQVDGWSAAECRWLRRLALVATVGRNGVRADPSRTFEICLRLAADRDDMVEKAVSWALRYLSQKERTAVATFFEAEGDRFGARVRREVRHKLSTGRKSPASTRLPA